jgi:hypothetical protein
MRGERELAAKYARDALEAAAKQHTGLRYHPTLGLVKIKDQQIHEELGHLAAG